MYRAPKNDIDYSLMMLNKIMSRRRLTFNPYTVSDARLLDIAMNTGWGNELDIVQIVIMDFVRLRPTSGYRNFDGVYFRLGQTPGERFLPTGALIYPVTAYDDLCGVRSTYGRRSLRHHEDVERLIGHKAFVSRLIRGVDINGNEKYAYRMHPFPAVLLYSTSLIRTI